jgi:hypothetical protein
VVANRVADRIRERFLRNTRREALPGWNRRVCMLDGSSVKPPYTPDVTKVYPPATNQ